MRFWSSTLRCPTGDVQFGGQVVVPMTRVCNTRGSIQIVLAPKLS
jgi:hypothetical protein